MRVFQGRKGETLKVACLWALGILLPLISCKARLNEPPFIRYGEEVCAECQMIISEARFASALVTEKGETYKFDDLRCLLTFREGLKGKEHRIWVQDYNGGGWLDAEEAIFVRSKRVMTPMGSGLVAVRGKRQAEMVVEKMGGEILRFEELKGF